MESNQRKNLRSAEKHRESTCLFADIAAKTALTAYKAYSPTECLEIFESQSTVLSAILLLDRKKEQCFLESSGVTTLELRRLTESKETKMDLSVQDLFTTL